MRIGILGPLEVRAAGGGPVEIGGARLRALLILLALDAGRPVPAERIIGDLWEDRAPAGAPNALQSLVSRLRAAIGRDRVESGAGAYRLAVPPSAIDAHDFESRVRAARRTSDPAARAAELREALAIWRGPALAGAAGLPFAEGPAARLEGLRRTALDERVDADLALGRHAELIPELQALAAADPLREPLRGRLIRALYGAGRQADALAEHDAIKDVLAETLGVDPSPDLEALRLSVLRQDPALLPAAPPPVQPPAPAPAPAGNLRARLTSFIGRDGDLARVGGLLARGRLVTLTGPGGAGKTRLSLEAGERLAARMPDGVWLVEFAPVLDPAEVPQAALAALGLREAVLAPAGLGRKPADAADPLDRLTTALAGKRLLLLLDNCEHLLDAAATLAERVLARCPDVRILATSREPLGITGESLWPVDSLEPPPPAAGAAEAMGYPAVRLFADRAAAVAPGFEVTAANVARVVRICRALDGMPLAIELAAARLRAMTPAQVAVRLDDRFRLLTAGSRTALPRHQTLRAVVEWSWELLDEAERALWRRLAVFRGGATLEAAEEVCAGPELDRADVLDTLAALVDKSLVLVRETARDDERPRYLMLETLRAYGLERLAEAGERDRLLRAHAVHYVRFAEAAEPHLYRREQVGWLARLTAEHDNTHAALRWAISTGEAALGARLCAGLGWYWFLSGQLGDGADQVARVAALPGLPADGTTATALALGAMTALDDERRDLGMVGDWLRRAQEICATVDGADLHPVLRVMLVTLSMYLRGWEDDSLEGVERLFADPDPWVRGVARFVRGQIAINFGRTATLEEDFAEGLASFAEAGDRWGLSFTMAAQAEILARDGDHRGAAARYEEALRLNSELGGVSVVLLHVHMKLANELELLGERDRAEALLKGAMRDARRRGGAEEKAALHYQLGEFARRAGERDDALRHLAAAEGLTSGTGGPPQFHSLVLCARAQLDASMGDVEAARARLDEALRRASRAADFPIVAYVLAGFADLARRRGDPGRAAELLGAGDGLRGARDLSQPDVIEIGAAARSELGEAAFTAAYERGRALTFGEVLGQFGLAPPPPHGAAPARVRRGS